MPVLSLNINLSSLQTQRRLTESTSTLAKSYERLSSGLRVSRAADDSAGLAIASGLNVDARVFAQGLKNLSDGVSVTNIAEGALNQLTNIVTRLQELAEQSANGTLGAKQRNALDAEGRALSKEYLRIAQTTEFNGLKLFDGSVQGLSLQAGYGASGGLRSSLGGKMGTGNFDATGSFATGEGPSSVVLGDLNGDGAIDLLCANQLGNSLSVLLGNGDGTFRAKTDLAAEGWPYTAAVGDVNGDGALDIVSTGNFSSVLIGNGDGTFKTKTDISAGASHFIAFGDLNGDHALDIVSVNGGAGPDAASVLLGNGDGTFQEEADFAIGTNCKSAALGDLNGDGILDIISANPDDDTASVLIGNGDGSFKARIDLATGDSPQSVALGDLNGDEVVDIVCVNAGSETASVFLGNGNGTFKEAVDFLAGQVPLSVALGDLNGDGALDIVSAKVNGCAASVLLGNGDGTFQEKALFGPDPSFSTSVAVGDLSGDGVLDIVFNNGDGNDTVSVLLAKTRDGVSSLLDFSLRTKAGALQALPMFKQTLNNLSSQRGLIGANQSRLTTAIANLQVERENYAAASSRITDVDVANESAQLSRTQILQQAGAAVLAQANQSPALALKLLSG